MPAPSLVSEPTLAPLDTPPQMFKRLLPGTVLTLMLLSKASGAVIEWLPLETVTLDVPPALLGRSVPPPVPWITA